MPLLWPHAPTFVNESEHRVWSALVDQLGENDLLIANQHFTTRQRDHELDLAVVLHGHGVVVLEVKGGRVWVEDGRWWQAGRSGPHEIRPVEQARENRYVLRDWVEESAAWAGRRRVRWAHGIVLPGTDLDPRFAMPDCAREMVIDAGDLVDIASRLRTLLDTRDDNRDVPDGEAMLAIHASLQGRFTPSAPSASSVERRLEQSLESIERVTAEQAKILDAIRLLRRVEIRGGAGSGKTWLAVEQARRLSRAGDRVALICYSRGLAEWMRRHVTGLDRRERPAYVGTFHGLGREWGVDVDGSDDDSDFWENRLPRQMAEAARAQPDGRLFDAVIIDEAQDFADTWWPGVLGALRHDDGALYVFNDEGQRVFPRFGDAPAGLVTLVLDQNVRNTRQISSAFAGMAPDRLRISTHDGPAIRFVECSRDEALACADDAVDGLLDEGFAAKDVALLTTGSRHPEQVARQEEGWESYWSSFWDDEQVFYGHVMGFKGLERPAVVLAVNEHADRERARERLYVGLSRPRDLLVVCGDPEQLESVGGPALVRRLREGH